MRADTQTEAFGLRSGGHTILRVYSNDVSYWVIFSFKWEQRNNGDISGQQREREASETASACVYARVCKCVFTAQQRIWCSQGWIHSTHFPVTFTSIVVFPKVFEMPWMVSCLNQCLLMCISQQLTRSDCSCRWTKAFLIRLLARTRACVCVQYKNRQPLRFTVDINAMFKIQFELMWKH